MAFVSLQKFYGEAVEKFGASAEQVSLFYNDAAALRAQQWLSRRLMSFFLVAVVAWTAIRMYRHCSMDKKNSSKKFPPGVPGGLPLIGNMLQLNSQKPHCRLTEFAEAYGPIYRLDLGALKYVVLSSPDLAKEAAVTKFELISKRKTPSNLKVWSNNKNILAVADYGEEYRTLKKLVVSRVLGAAPQKSLGPVREDCMKTVIDEALSKLKDSEGLLNVRECIKQYIFPFVMRQIMGYVPESLYVEELGNLDTWDIFDHLVVNAMKSVLVVDWRDFFPYLSWVSNPTFKREVVEVERVKSLVIRALIKQKRNRLQRQDATGGFLEHMLTAEKDMSDFLIEQMTWEPIIEGSDTSLVTAEWAIYHLAKNPEIQNRVYEEIHNLVGGRMVTESDLPNLPLMDAIFKETLRRYSPILLLPPREVEADLTIGGFHIPKGWQVLVNVYGINNDKKRWTNPEKWIPDRFLNAPELDLGVSDFQAIPFGLGKRRCAGVLQATTVVCSFVASFVQHFQCSLPPHDESYLSDTAYFTNQKLHPLTVIATVRENKDFC